jgi:hypothetical protein
MEAERLPSWVKESRSAPVFNSTLTWLDNNYDLKKFIKDESGHIAIRIGKVDPDEIGKDNPAEKEADKDAEEELKEKLRLEEFKLPREEEKPVPAEERPLPPAASLPAPAPDVYPAHPPVENTPPPAPMPPAESDGATSP